MRKCILAILVILCLRIQAQDCDLTLFSEPFGAIVPVGWTGDFNMLGGGLVEGWATSSGPSLTPGTGPSVPAEGSH